MTLIDVRSLGPSFAYPCQDMWMASCIHKGKTLNQQVVPAERVLEMVTVNGARALLWEDELGALEAGKKADIVVINPNSANMLVHHNPPLCNTPHLTTSRSPYTTRLRISSLVCSRAT